CLSCPSCSKQAGELQGSQQPPVDSWVTASHPAARFWVLPP
ncbi:hypothetical protein A2U01_0097647, partial [Trifolium medium]|nr:hypothetical protein [Trifolium medium]